MSRWVIGLGLGLGLFSFPACGSSSKNSVPSSQTGGSAGTGGTSTGGTSTGGTSTGGTSTGGTSTGGEAGASGSSNGGTGGVAGSDGGTVVIDSVEPAVGPKSGNVPVKIKGSGFLAGATATIGGANVLAANVTFTEISGMLPAKSSCGTVDVQVTNPLATPVTAQNLFAYQCDAVTFGVPQKKSVFSSGYVTDMALGNLDQDPRDELAVSVNPNKVIVFDVTLGGGISQLADLGNVSDARSVAIGQLNNDSIADLVVAHYGPGQVDVWTNSGAPSFTQQTPFQLAAGGSFPQALAIADFDGAGNDVAVGTFNDDLTVLEGHNDGTLGPSEKVGPGTQHRVVALTLPGDTLPDLASVHCQLRVYPNTPTTTGTFPVVTPATYDVGRDPQDLVVGELNGDTYSDIVVANTSVISNCGNVNQAHSVSVLLGLSDGSFAPAVHYPTGNNPSGVTLADFDADGKLDIATANADGSVSVLPGDGQGAFGSAIAVAGVGTVTSPRRILSMLVDGDTRPDLLVSSSNQPAELSILLNTSN